jgi:hypothetical protein
MSGEREVATDGGALPETLTYEGWCDGLKNGRLFGQACRECGHVGGTPKAACPHCGSRGLETVSLPTTGEVYTETTVNVPPAGVEERGYQVVIVAVGDARVMARLEGEHVDIGEEVRLAGYVSDEGGAPAPLFEPV